MEYTAFALCVPGATIDAAVAHHLLESLTASNLDISLAVLNELEQNAQEQERQWQLRLERARYEAERAQRQFDAVEARESIGGSHSGTTLE